MPKFTLRKAGTALAAAEERDVLGEWSGLGYDARARNLHRAARLVTEKGGSIPRSVEELRAPLPHPADILSA